MTENVLSASEPLRQERAPARGQVGFTKQLLALVRKDLALEWRGRARINATLFFALLVMLLFSFAMGPDHKLLTRTAPGFLWLAIFLSSVLSLGESMRIERENDALEGLCLVPVDPRALFLAKAMVNTGFLVLLSLVILPVTIGVYGVELRGGFWPMLGVLAVGCAGISAPGTLQAGIAVQARARDVLLPLLLFPILVPSLLAAVKATDLVMHGDPMGQGASWAALLGAFALIYWILCTLLFGKIIQ